MATRVALPVLARWAAAAAVAAVVGAVHLRWRPATLCPLRALTGIPCPVCGGTTAVAAAGRLDPLGAVRANPAVVAGAGLLLTAPLLPAGTAAWWAARPAWWRRSAVAAILLAAELWQLGRFGLLPH